MAAVSSTENLREEATCSICLDYFKDPVISACGHNFCCSCITRCWEGLDANFTCPQCRETFQQRVLIPNRQLANMVEIAKQLLQKRGKEPVCEKHYEALKLFCENDQKPICVVCGLSQDHKAHTMHPLEEAVQKYKTQLHQCLQELRSNLENIQMWQSSEEEKTGKVKIQVEAQRKIITSEFEELRQFLNEEEQVFLSSLKKEEKEILEKLNANISQLKVQSSSLEQQIAEIEKKCQQPAMDFLNEVETILSRGRSMKCLKPKVVYCELRKTTRGIPWQIFVLNNIEKKLKVSVTLDSETANSNLFLSENQKLARWVTNEQAVETIGKRFDAYPCVLGCEGFISGKHYWAVQIGNGINWSIGVARESVSRKGDATWLRNKALAARKINHAPHACFGQPKPSAGFYGNQYEAFSNSISPEVKALQKKSVVESPERGIWALELSNGRYNALTTPVTHLTLENKPQKLGVCLDYDGGRLAFYNADTGEPLYTFTASFTEKIFPYFCLWDGELMSL
uniref:E3 ubiquitin-protein ligase TRIM39-like n=1 Tax=Geotrypetes seraphini TaxID=260995 RepID=A0A6P8NUM6_GEOSA|nr:E3 ubiquitin-protein ligase TRIM39-like [Geotrypetes seraphini]